MQRRRTEPCYSTPVSRRSFYKALLQSILTVEVVVVVVVVVEVAVVAEVVDELVSVSTLAGYCNEKKTHFEH